jgi:hypothetical protein
MLLHRPHFSTSNRMPRGAREWFKAGKKTGVRLFFWVLGLLCCPSLVHAETMAEYQIKAAFLYNFLAFTEWPAEVGSTITLCVYGPDPFGEDLNKMQSKRLGTRNLAVKRVNSVDGLQNCQAVFITRPVMSNLRRVLDNLNDRPVLTVADSQDAALQGVALNMNMDQNKVTFEANLAAARRNRLNLSSKLLRLATKVFQ